MTAYDDITITVTVKDLKHEFYFTISCADLNDFLDIAERFPRNIYSFGEIEVNKVERVSLYQ